MERTLLKKMYTKYVLILIALLTFGFVGAQTITTLALDPDQANKLTFTLTNGNGTNRHFLPYHGGNMRYIHQIRPIGGTFVPVSDLINLTNPPVGDGASGSYEHNFFMAAGYTPGLYQMRILALRSGQFNVSSNIIDIELKYDVSIEGLTDTGYVRCQTPAVSYRLATVRNTGNLPQTYDLNLDENIAPTEQNLASDILSLEGEPINSTPQLSAGATFSFLVRIAAIQGTQPDKNNYTALIATAQSDGNISDYEVIHTWTYCGNGNSLPNNPDAPDLLIVKSGPNNAIIGEQMQYTLTLLNNTNTTQEAILPTMTDSIPVNLDIVNIYKSPTDTRDITISFDEITRVLEVTYSTNNQNKFEPGDPPINIYIDVVPNCYVTPQVINTAFASSGSDDSNYDNNTSSVYTDMLYDTSNQVNWTGNVNIDWFDCANWDKGIVPNEDINATIPTTAGNNPIIDSGSSLAPPNGTAEVRDITIMNGKSLEMINSILEVNGNWTNNWGTLIPGNGTVAFVGSDTDQTILDLSEEPSFYNLTVNTTNDFKVLVGNDQGLHVNNQLNLQNGVLRLEGKSQLLQPDGATVIATTGKLWRDQRGHANMYNYNYWSSPVGTTTTNYQIANVMKDGSDIFNFQNIQWTGGVNGDASSTPITISNRWLYKFQSTSPLYANWQKIYQNDPIQAGLGYTMKGSGTNDPSDTQNYIFVGVPFTGNITNTISDGQISLLGNPYASALDADKFIDDNESVIDGYLEFWDHFETTNSHLLAAYKGGYAKLNKTEQIEAVNVDGNESNRLPQQFIPVGQGFFVTAKPGISNNSSIVFRNSQRAFVKEDEAGGMQMFGIPDGDGSTAAAGTFEEPTKIKLNLISAGDYKHQIAIGFMQDKASEEIDYGYDARLRDTDPNQFYFMHPEEKLVIQGVGYFDEENKYPLGVIADAAGRYTFTIDHIENLDENTAVYLYDNEKQIYHNLRKSDYFVNLAKGEYNTRFSLRFKNFALENDLNTQQLLDNIVVYHQNNYVIIANPSEETTILKATMFNMLGQNVTNWNIENGRESHIELPLQSLAAGVYVVQVQTDQGSVSKKINIK